MSKTYLQEKITGTEGQVVMINGQGEAEAQSKDFGLKPRLSVSVESGAVVTVSGNGENLTKTSTGAVLNFDLSGYGTYSVVATKNGKTSNTVSVEVDTVQIYEVALTFFSATITVTVPSGSTVTCSKGGVTQTKTSTGTAVFTVTETGTYTLKATKDGEEAEDTATITSNGQSVSVTLAYVHIYGVQWDGTSSTVWSRTDESAGFTNPVPAVNNGTGSSPFDNLMPWSGMVKSTDSAAGTLVSIPKFWYKWTRSGSTMKLQIADKATAGFSVSPAHQDRGDGSGERDVVYVGRYHCHTSNYKSQSGGKPKASITRANARSGIHNLGSTIWQFDFAMLWTIYMLYLVEFADWNAQKTIGYGCGNNSGTENMGATDSMQYHTGTAKSNRSTYGVGCQYRWIEDLWGNVYDWVDGIYFSGSTIYGIKKPASFSDSSGGTNIGTRPTSGGYISAYGTPTASGFEWALYPSAVAGSESTYICDYCYYNSSGVVLRCGGGYSQIQNYGLFYLSGNDAASSSYAYVGCRLQKLP